eukprot:gene32501-39296_t
MENSSIDEELQRCSQSYQGVAKFQRLLFVVNHSSPKDKSHALRFLLREITHTDLVDFYKKKIRTLDEQLLQSVSEEFEKAQNWMVNTEQNLATIYAMQDVELRSATSTLVKESIRLAITDLVNLHLRAGKLEEAARELLRMRDYCSSPAHHSALHSELVTISLLQGHYLNAVNFMHKVLDVSSDRKVVERGVVVQALGGLAEGTADFKLTAQKLLSLSAELGNSFSDVLSAADIGLYGVLCAFASLSPSALHTQLLDNKAFLHTYVTANTSHPLLKEVVSAYSQKKYTALLRGVEALLLGGAAQRDVYLHAHCDKLLRSIKNQIYLTYLAPYGQISLHTIAQELGGGEAELLDILAELIWSGKLAHAKIDMRNHTLSRTHPTSTSPSPSSSSSSAPVKASSSVHKLLAGLGVGVERALLRLSVDKQGLFLLPQPPQVYDREDVLPEGMMAGAGRGAKSRSTPTNSSRAQGSGRAGPPEELSEAESEGDAEGKMGAEEDFGNVAEHASDSEMHVV